MARKAFILVGCLAVLAFGSWVFAQRPQASDADMRRDRSLPMRDRFELTLIGKESAILLDVQSGDSWYLKDAGPGTIWLTIPRINSNEELEKWRSEFGADE
jgi:hypothetical protein